jgi:hypothetical protein
MWGGSGADTFHLYFNGQDIQLNDAGTGFDPGYNNIGATIHDYVLGTDHISWEEGNQATNGVTGLNP